MSPARDVEIRYARARWRSDAAFAAMLAFGGAYGLLAAGVLGWLR